MQAVEERVSTLERVLEEFIIHTEESQINVDIALTRLERGLEEFKDEMRVFKDEMSDFKDEMSDFKNEMSDFKDEMSGFKDRMEASHKEMNKQWAFLAKKMGTLDEDLVSPAVRPVISKYFGCDPTKTPIRELRRIGGDSFEVDVLAVCEDKVFMIEVRATPKIDYVGEILDKVPLFKEFYPEYADKEVIPIFASIVFPENIIQYATRKGLYIMAYREWEYMDIINFDELGKNRGDRV
jgi:FtsZ-binding cell division protein ZapB